MNALIEYPLTSISIIENAIEHVKNTGYPVRAIHKVFV